MAEQDAEVANFRAPKPELAPLASTVGGTALYQARLVAELIGDTGISDSLGFAARVIEGKYLTGLEEYIDDFRAKGFIGDLPRPSSVPKNLRRDTTRLAQRYVRRHEYRIETDLEDLISLQAAFPGLLYSVRAHGAKPVEGTVEKVKGFEKEIAFGSLIPHLRPVYAQEMRLLNSRIAVCDISRFDAEQQASLRPYLAEAED
jgi:hypothetical protein